MDVHIICPVDGTTTEQRTSRLSAYLRSETQLYSSYHAASYAVELLMFVQAQNAGDRAFSKDTIRILGFSLFALLRRRCNGFWFVITMKRTALSSAACT
nr:MAG TPA: hypothetical protein [Caudoviricetes sp.]